MGRRPERSEGCIAIARQDNVRGTFLNSPPLDNEKILIRLFCAL